MQYVHTVVDTVASEEEAVRFVCDRRVPRQGRSPISRAYALEVMRRAELQVTERQS